VCWPTLAVFSTGAVAVLRGKEDAAKYWWRRDVAPQIFIAGTFPPVVLCSRTGGRVVMVVAS
jgi:hypothetical protein